MGTIRILAVSDVHGYIYPYSYADGIEHHMGYACLKTEIDQLRDNHTVVIDNGDVLEGSPLMYFHYQYHPDDIAPVTKVMREMGFTYMNIGNHDFNYGEECLMNHLQNTGVPCITSNFIFHGKPYGPTYEIREIDGKKVAFFGLVTQYIPHFEKKAHIKHSKFTDGCETAKKTVDLLKSLEHPDYIICVYHGGLERDEFNNLTEPDTGENEACRIMSAVPDIDVMITGHQHHSLVGKWNQTVYTQTADKGTQIACVEIDTDTDEINARLINVKAEPDPTIEAVCQDEEDACQEWLDQEIGSANMDLSISDVIEARLHKSQMVTFINKVQMQATGAQLSSTAVFNNAVGFGKTITMRNIVSTYVFPNTLVVKKINGRTLRLYLEQCADYWSLHNEKIVVNKALEDKWYNYDMVDGVDYTIKVSNTFGERIVSLTYQGIEVKDTDEFTIAITNYRAGGAGGFEMLADAKTVGVYSESIVELIADYIRQNPVIDFKPVNNIEIVK